MSEFYIFLTKKLVKKTKLNDLKRNKCINKNKKWIRKNALEFLKTKF